MFLPITLFRISFPFVTKLSNGKNHCPSFLLLLLRRLLQTREEERRERLQLSTSCSPPPFNALSPLFYLNTCVSVSTQGGFLAPLLILPLLACQLSPYRARKKEGTWMVRDSPNDARKKFKKLIQYVAFVQIKFHQRKAFFLYCTVGSCLKREEESNSRPATQTAMAAAAAVNYCCPG